MLPLSFSMPTLLQIDENIRDLVTVEITTACVMATDNAWQQSFETVAERDAFILQQQMWTDCVFLVGPDDTSAEAPRLEGELHFVRALLAIGHLLPGLAGGKEAQAIQLRAELNQINLNLPARVWLSIHSSTIPHHISVTYSSVLNSKQQG